MSSQIPDLCKAGPHPRAFGFVQAGPHPRAGSAVRFYPSWLFSTIRWCGVYGNSVRSASSAA
ncbi:MAG TPA: hypothetical protein VG963_28545, partial [Polyangiaceae bacterium]|nr:hypothetical protein [Polyangiaceae bacterium]